MERLECFLDDAVFAGMERQDGRAAARGEGLGELFHELVKDFIFVVDVDAERLERAGAALLDGVLFFFGRRALREMDGAQCALDGFMECLRRLDGTALFVADNLLCDGGGKRLVSIFDEHALDFVLRHLGKALSGGRTGLGIEPQVERAVRFVRKATRRVVNLHGRDAEVGEYEVEWADVTRELVNLAEIHAAEAPAVVAIAFGADAGDGLFGLDGIDVATIEMARAAEGFEHLERVAAIAERRVETTLARLDAEHGEDFVDHDGDVHAGRGVAFGDDVGDFVGVFFGIQFFVFFREVARVFAAVVNAAMMRLVSLFVLCHDCFLMYQFGSYGNTPPAAHAARPPSGRGASV